MDLDDLLTPKKPAGPKLETLSVEELETLIGELEAKIGEARAVIETKRKGRSAADAFFKK